MVVMRSFSRFTTFALVSACLLALGIARFATAETSDSAKKQPTLLSYGDGKPDGKKSYGGSGHLIEFELPEGVTKIKGIRIHGSRYGTAQAPTEDFEITFLSDKRDEV